MKIKKIIIDNGHGADTMGKCSPDIRLREYAWTRDLARRVSNKLKSLGHETHLLVAEDKDVPLRERVARVNSICNSVGHERACILLSLHVNASGILPQWRAANGWSVYIALNGSKDSANLAEHLARKAAEKGLRLRRQYPGKGYWRQSLAMVRDTVCPAVLTENLFMDNEEDCSYLLSEAGRETIASLHAEAIHAYCLEKEAA